MSTKKNCAECACELTRDVTAYRLPTKEIRNWPNGVFRPVSVLLCAPCYEKVIYTNAPEGIAP